MEILVGKTAGFCFGVKNAITKTEEKLSENKKIYCLGELVHNSQVTEELVNKGIIFIEKIEEGQERVIIRSHGVEKKIYEKAKDLNLELIDLTCPKVLHIHKIAEEYSEKGYFIFLIGNKEHPEMLGTVSFCNTEYCVIEKEEQLENAIKKFENSKCDKALVISQTTYSLENFKNIVQNMKEKIELQKLEIKNTICSATQERQEETESIAKQVDCMIIVGGKHSSNSNKLYELAMKHCKSVMFVETDEEIETDKLKNVKKIGVMAGASTPQKSIEKVVEKLQVIC